MSQPALAADRRRQLQFWDANLRCLKKVTLTQLIQAFDQVSAQRGNDGRNPGDCCGYLPARGL